MYVENSLPGSRYSSILRLDNSSFQLNKAKAIPTKPNANGNGGGIFATGSQTTIMGSDLIIEDCSCDGNGGGSSVSNGANVKFYSSAFVRNTALSGNGGALFVTSPADIKDHNSSDRSSVHVEGSTFGNFLESQEDNQQSSVNATIGESDASKATQSIEVPRISALKGGAIYVDKSTATVIQSSFNSIGSENEGGAMYMSGTKGSATIEEVSIYNCQAEKSSGGAAHITNFFDAEFTNTNVEFCKAKDGGAFSVESATLFITGTNLTSNDARGSSQPSTNSLPFALLGKGGAILSENKSTVLLESSIVEGGHASYGGAIFASDSSLLLENAKLSNNRAKNDGQGSIKCSGGALFSTGGTLSITGSNIRQNTAYLGGAITTTLGTNVTINNVRIENNMAGNKVGVKQQELYDSNMGGGGALVFSQSYVLMSDSKLYDNHVVNGDGGGIFVSVICAIADASTNAK